MDKTCVSLCLLQPSAAPSKQSFIESESIILFYLIPFTEKDIKNSIDFNTKWNWSPTFKILLIWHTVCWYEFIPFSFHPKSDSTIILIMKKHWNIAVKFKNYRSFKDSTQKRAFHLWHYWSHFKYQPDILTDKILSKGQEVKTAYFQHISRAVYSKWQMLFWWTPLLAALQLPNFWRYFLLQLRWLSVLPKQAEPASQSVNIRTASFGWSITESWLGSWLVTDDTCAWSRNC